MLACGIAAGHYECCDVRLTLGQGGRQGDCYSSALEQCSLAFAWHPYLVGAWSASFYVRGRRGYACGNAMAGERTAFAGHSYRKTQLCGLGSCICLRLPYCFNVTATAPVLEPHMNAFCNIDSKWDSQRQQTLRTCMIWCTCGIACKQVYLLWPGPKQEAHDMHHLTVAAFLHPGLSKCSATDSCTLHSKCTL